MPPIPGRDKIDLHAEVNLGVFGLLRPDQFTGLVTGDKAKEAVSVVLQKFSFPSLNVIFSASARMRQVDHDSAKVDTKLNQMEMRMSITPFNQAGQPINDPSQLAVLGLFPFETKAEKEDPTFQMTPNISDILTAIPGIPSAITGIVSGLGLAFAPLFKPKFPILTKAFFANPNEFGWYLKSSGEEQKEGIHYGTAFLQMSRDVAKLQVKIKMASDWDGGGVDVQNEPDVTLTLDVKHPKIPETPQITDFTSSEDLPLVIPRDDVKTLLSLTDQELDALITAGDLVAFGQGKKQITKGSLLKLLGLPPTKP